MKEKLLNIQNKENQNMYAFITGASSGIGKELAILLAKKGYNLILIARREKRLLHLKKSLESRYPIKVMVETCDLSDAKSCITLHNTYKNYPVTVLINGAGFGKVGNVSDIPLEYDLSMLHTNITALHILSKLFASTMDHGYILNIASIAAFQPGPYLATYSATKSYVASFSIALNYEMKRKKKPIHIATLCPGPVDTEFNQVAGTSFSLPSISAKKCAKIALHGLFRKKTLIIPSLSIKLNYIGSKLSPLALILPLEYKIQTAKLSSKKH
ncbi:SDR family oxidoreductase [Lachnospiraceae bacterium WCA-693-APC-MOT-I]|uniref:SDR family oxidoreductase n=2 Tax=Velocimicrobium porci TaxID=2606634 RepID=A0A6L5XXJ2_9FIRM|nr:SDR family oxidoreductase [Velocimicrobium porci]